MATKKSAENLEQKPLRKKSIGNYIDSSSKTSISSKEKIDSSEKSLVQTTDVENSKKTRSADNSFDKNKYNGSTITLKQIISGDGRGKKQIGTLKGLGLNKINKVSTLQDTVAIRGMINKVNHLIKIISEGKDNVK